MNFKLIFIFLFLGCGVKGPPKPPPGTEQIPWTQEYLSTKEIKEDSKKK